nr:MAG TPA: hypothetical protein [Caudoviricetes sp.]
MRFFTSFLNRHSAYSSPNVHVREYKINCNSSSVIFDELLSNNIKCFKRKGK